MNGEQLTKEDIIFFLRENKKYLSKHFGITNVALFGSYARDEAKSDSDIDILIETEQKNFDNLFNIKEYFEENFNKKVDVGFFASVRPFIMRFIKEELIYA